MFGRAKKPPVTYGALIDIGSGSVGGAVLVVDHLNNTKEILFETRTWLVKSEGETDRLRATKEALLTVVLELGNAGIRAALDHNSSAKIENLYIGISAPWAYTVSRNIEYGTDEPVKISHELIDDLSKSAEEQAVETLQEEHIAEAQNLTIINRATTSLTANGYAISPDATVVTDTIKLSHSSSLAHTDLLNTIKEIIDPVFPDIGIVPYTFAFVYYQVVADMVPSLQNVCLIDITADATEMIIVKDGALSYVSHIDCGNRTIAREVAEAAGVPLTEALTYLKADESTALSEAVGQCLESAAVNYMKQLAKLLKSDGDHLSVPETIYLHTGDRTEGFFGSLIKSAVEEVTQSTHSVHSVSKNILKKQSSEDSALYILSHFFHTQESAYYDSKH